MKKIILLLITIHLALITVHAQNWVLCGTTTTGGDSLKYGTVFRYNIRTGKDTVLLNFHDTSNGAYPYGSMDYNADSLLYGFTEEGGLDTVGTIFSVNPKTGKDSVRYRGFDMANGRYPYQGSLSFYNNLYYGMTYSGGAHNNGVIFTFDPLNNNYNIVDNFINAGGKEYYPYGVHLTPYDDGFLYGMTLAGGANNAGAIFRFNPVTHHDTVMVSLTTATGANPTEGMLVLNPKDSLLYGVNTFGGTHSVGSLFSFNPHTGAYNVLFQFGAGNGSQPLGSLLYYAPDSAFYGMTSAGGTYNFGAIYRYTPSTAKDTVLYSFNGTSGKGPAGNLTIGPDSTLLYGLTQYGGTQDSGVLFSFNPKTGLEGVLASFNTRSGAEPYGTLSLVNIGINVTLINQTNNVCAGDHNGSITIQAHNGFGAYTYSWAPNGGSSATASNLTSGVYTLTVSDKNGIGYIGTYTITPNGMNVVIDSTINWTCASTLWAVVTNGASPYTYSWSPGAATNDTIHNVCPGLYQVIVTDNHGCHDSAHIVLVTTGINQLTIKNGELKVFPNPSNGTFTFQIRNYQLGIRNQVEVYNMLGQKVYMSSLNPSVAGVSNTTISMADGAGVYLYRVLTENGTLLGQGRLVLQK